MSEEACWWPAGRVAAAIATRKLSATEYLDGLLRRVAGENPDLGLIVTLNEHARQQARAADDAVVRGEPLGPLHGVSMTVKDSFTTAGIRTAAGSTMLVGNVPAVDADAVARVRRAGAIVLGKTNVPEQCADVQTSHPVFGTSRNPWRPDHTPGGSSGGAAGAVAAGFTPVELGSDIAGSIRLPAGHCGIFGHRPSFGVVSTAGHLPPFQPVVSDLCTVGPLARSVDDLELMLDVVAGPRRQERSAWRLRLPEAREPRRVAAWFDDPHCPVDSEIRDALEHAARALQGSGVVVEWASPPGVSLSVSDEVNRRLLSSVAQARYTTAEIRRIASGELTTRGELGDEFAAQSYRDWLEADTRRHRLAVLWGRFFERYDAILLPVTPNLVPRHDHRPFGRRRIEVNGVERPYWDQIVWAGLTAICRLPTTVVPTGLDSRGLPMGIAITGPYLGDRTTLAVARRLVALLPPLGRPPRISRQDAKRRPERLVAWLKGAPFDILPSLKGGDSHGRP
ncbi:amidase [Sinosporangium album]|uniref:Amidase n=1 Tax=Sinosporangium album TaxID=504805 RepID=A0A1G8A603_9ACTN|nr:amidase [Sinosporangium album]